MEVTQELQYALNTLWFVLAGALGGQLAGIAAIAGFTFAASFAVWFLLRRTMGIRIGETEEYEGGDIAECGMHAYPEFVSSTLVGGPGAAPGGAHAASRVELRPDKAPA